MELAESVLSSLQARNKYLMEHVRREMEAVPEIEAIEVSCEYSNTTLIGVHIRCRMSFTKK